jgi:hypothetical protein
LAEDDWNRENGDVNSNAADKDTHVEGTKITLFKPSDNSSFTGADNIVGIQFQPFSVPKYATITSAYITFEAHNEDGAFLKASNQFAGRRRRASRSEPERERRGIYDDAGDDVYADDQPFDATTAAPATVDERLVSIAVATLVIYPMWTTLFRKLLGTRMHCTCTITFCHSSHPLIVCNCKQPHKPHQLLSALRLLSL